MSRRALRRAGGLCVVSIGLALALGYLHAGGALGVFAAEVTNKDATFSAGWVAAATGLGTPSPSGYDVSLAWTPGNHGVTGQEVWGADGGTGAAASCGGYAKLATLASATTASYLDSNRGSALNGHWYCYRLVSTHGSWTAQATFPAQRIGLAATGLAIANNNNTIGNNDTITLTFNQRATGPTTIRVCVWSSSSGNAIVLGDTTGSCTSASDASSIGKLTVSGATIATTRTFNNSTVTYSTTAPWTATITLRNGSNSAVSGGTWTFTGSSTPGVVSFATTHQASLCSSTALSCSPSTTTHF